MKICIISGRFPPSEFPSSINHKIYADKFGYHYIHCNWPTKANSRYINKIFYILEYIDCYDYIIWIDDDAFFLNFDIDIMDYSPKGKEFISACKSPTFKNLKTFFSSGQFILRCSSESKHFLKDILKQDIKTVKNWWKPELGYFTSGDQDIMTYLFLTNSNYTNSFCFYDYRKFNSRVENIFGKDKHTPLILHFTGKPEIKLKNHKRVQEKLNLQPCLVPFDLLNEYNIKTSNKNRSYLKRFIKLFR